ncbi:MAG TPA: zinc-dependent metalloprotease [Phycisphaerales bacterium]|nr:zinc-dependent metalloprotease [Phycisphaerales bacterium]
MNAVRIRTRAFVVLAGSVFGLPAAAQQDFPPFEKVSEGFRKVTPPADGAAPLYTVWVRDRDGQMLAELPAGFEGQRFFVVPTVAGGDAQAGVYSIWHYAIGQDARYLYWQQYDKRLALIEPNMAVRTTGDAESQAATERIFTDRVVLTTPIVAMGPGGGPVIDFDDVLLRQSGAFFGNFTRGADVSLAKIKSAKTFPSNVELTLEFPRAGGQLASVHYSIGVPPQTPGYEPREADRRVGYYYTSFTDRSRRGVDGQTMRYVNRWHVEKADPARAISPPKKPIVYYIEHTTPVRYRRWVRDGVLAWNKAFERVGIVNAIEVYQQDAQTGAHMDKDPEDLRYSFVRWTNSSMGFAIGPVHAHPDTGEIYEADIVMDEGFLAGWAHQYRSSILAAAAMRSLDGETAEWLLDHPQWDPRYRLAEPEDRARVSAYARAIKEGTADPAEAPPTMLPMVWEQPGAGSRGGGCAAMPGLALSVADVRLAMDAGLILPEGSERDEASLLDGLPEEFIGPLLKDVIMHEVGHTLGLMHNWKGSAAHSFAEINSEGFRGKRPLLSTVMDYAPSNIVVEGDGLVQGDYACIDIGTYDHWAIEWGYTFDDPAKVATRAAEPGHGFSSEEGQPGPDPHAKTWDLGENSLDFADAEMRFVRHVSPKLLDKAVKDGEPWEKARQTWSQLLGKQLGALSTASHWVGGAHFNKYRKGDPGAPEPIRPVDVERQRRALKFIIENAFRDEAWGLTHELLAHLGTEQWPDSNWGDPQDVPVHDQVLGAQASAMTMLMNPTRLRRILDNELRTASGEDALTVPEVLRAIRNEVWSPLANPPRGATARNPYISSLRRNLQREHLDRLIDLATGMNWPNASGKTLATLARQELRDIRAAIGDRPEAQGIDPYSKAHLADSRERIDRALEAGYLRRQ